MCVYVSWQRALEKRERLLAESDSLSAAGGAAPSQKKKRKKGQLPALNGLVLTPTRELALQVDGSSTCCPLFLVFAFGCCCARKVFIVVALSFMALPFLLPRGFERHACPPVHAQVCQRLNAIGRGLGITCVAIGN